MKFEKYHGLGNDFIIFNKEDLDIVDFGRLSQKVCHRNFGIGADGMIVYEKVDGQIIMNFYNADGTTAPMCGNGIRCFTHYMYNNKLIQETVIDIKTGAGVLRVTIEDKEPFKVRVNMGKPNFNGKDIPIVLDTDEYIEKTLDVCGEEYRISSVFMGTTHTVVFVDEIDIEKIKTIGPIIEKDGLFPLGTNVNFCKVKKRDEIHVTTWERGAGLTLACGTGACAAVVLANRVEVVDKASKVIVPGGELYIELEDDVFMTGPSIKIAEGNFIY